jgi:hypothetical protein
MRRLAYLLIDLLWRRAVVCPQRRFQSPPHQAFLWAILTYLLADNMLNSSSDLVVQMAGTITPHTTRNVRWTQYGPSTRHQKTGTRWLQLQRNGHTYNKIWQVQSWMNKLRILTLTIK